MSAWTDKSIEERRAIVARRDPEKVKAADRARYYRDRDKRLAAQREWREREGNSEVMAQHRAAWIERNPDKRRAQVAVGNAIRDGKLVRQPCEQCGEPDAHAHHDDYAKPLEVRWLCRRHHGEAHRRVA